MCFVSFLLLGEWYLRGRHAAPVDRPSVRSGHLEKYLEELVIEFLRQPPWFRCVRDRRGIHAPCTVQNMVQMR